MFGVKFLIFLACLSWSQCKLDKYCSLCKNHTLCLYQGVGSECKGGGDAGVTSEDIHHIVGVHNWLRGIVASGGEHRGQGGPQPKAANLMKLEWDHELAKVAQRWADQCHFFHDTCRDDPRWKVGQNIYWAWKYPKHEANWTEAILSWYEEVSLYNPKDVEAYRFESSTGHYTQMLWHDTTSVGCGRRDYGPNKIYVCNYGPAGNWVNEPMYEIGEACSKCPKGYHCNSYLCERRKSINGSPLSDSNYLRALPVDESEDVESLQPPVENAQDVYAREAKKVINCTVEDETSQNNQQKNNQQQGNQQKNHQQQNNQEKNHQQQGNEEKNHQQPATATSNQQPATATSNQQQENQQQDNQQQDKQQKDIQYFRSLTVNDGLKVEIKATTNSIDGKRTEIDLELDPDIKLKIEEIQQQIENLVKDAIGRSNKKP